MYTASISPESGLVQKGENIEARIFLDGSDLIGIADIELMFDSSKIKLIKSSFEGSALPDGFELSLNPGNIFSVQGINPSMQPVSGRFLFGTFEFEVIGPGVIGISFGGKSRVLTDDGNDVLEVKKNAEYVSSITRDQLNQEITILEVSVNILKDILT